MTSQPTQTAHSGHPAQPGRPAQPAPDFTLPDQHGADFSLAAELTRRPVLLVFYPYAFSRICGSELRELRELRESLPHFNQHTPPTAPDAATAASTPTPTNNLSADAATGVTPALTIVAASCDPMYSLRVYAEQEHFEFPLLSDFWPHGAVARAYGVFDEAKGCARRGSFLIAQDGTVRWSVVNPISEPRPLSAYLDALTTLAPQPHPHNPLTPRPASPLTF